MIGGQEVGACGVQFSVSDTGCCLGGKSCGATKLQRQWCDVERQSTRVS